MTKILITGGIAIVAAGCLAYGARIFIQFKILDKTLANEHAADMETLRSTEQYFQHTLALAEQDNADLAQRLQDEQNRNNGIESQVLQISGAVDTFQKLSETDPQLLEKYSRVYFLNENCVPKSLTPIASSSLLDKNISEEFLTQALPYLVGMLNAAASDGVTLDVASAYRSFGEQSTLKSIYEMTYGSGANKFSADQGYSEHQLGTAVDLTTPDIGALTLKFASSTSYAWLTANAYKYGFELSYPQKNPYYIFEPWHWRFVGVALATWLHDSNISFYDAPQRTINQYLISLFD